MLFNSYSFIFLFLPVALLGFYGTARFGPRPAAAWLVLCSFVFYGWSTRASVLVLACSIGMNYIFSALIVRLGDRRTEQRIALFAAIILNLILMISCKYLLDGIAPLFGLAADRGTTYTVFPLAVSFFTFAQIGYLIDCRDSAHKPYPLILYALFVVFFPYLIAGPIVRHLEIMPQFLRGTHRFQSRALSSGLTIFILGLAKKVLFADGLAVFADAGFDHPDSLQVFSAWGSALAFSLELYFDFSGYSDMAVGAAQMFGIELPVNFNSPYKATSVIDFWQRWHITLTRFFASNIYFPIAAKTRHYLASPSPRFASLSNPLASFLIGVALPTVITGLLAAIWYGPGGHYMLFVILNLIYVLINQTWRAFVVRRDHRPPGCVRRAVRRAFAIPLTFLAVLVSLVMFRARSPVEALSVIGSMFGFNGIENGLPVPLRVFALLGETGRYLADKAVLVPAAGSSNLVEIFFIAALLAVIWLAPNTQEFMSQAETADTGGSHSGRQFVRWSPNIIWAILVSLLLFICSGDLDNSRPFIYFRF